MAREAFPGSFCLSVRQPPPRLFPPPSHSAHAGGPFRVNVMQTDLADVVEEFIGYIEQIPFDSDDEWDSDLDEVCGLIKASVSIVHHQHCKCPLFKFGVSALFF